ncbi:T9SS type A sorting domain-containing protein [Salibacter sp.]|uniref:T9SS type A sorting domain-containing protein n=1 Tax=Salibacter sp. TaxID=2010995 RepID=UPI0028702DFA|nr:T9SS type A sorting domain-containing protein [Salibacter sp.]MDR9487120.1 T9SS type A sorting domain-containing protein [Salibacter sp.]
MITFRHIILLLIALSLFSFQKLQGQNINIQKLQDYYGIRINNMIADNNGDLIIVGTKSLDNFYLARIDTTSYQIIDDTTYSDPQCLNPQNEFFDIKLHPEYGFVVTGNIQECGDFDPKIFWFDQHFDLVKTATFQHPYSSRFGYRMIFKDVIVRDDGHIISNFEHRRFSASANGELKYTFLYEFDKNLNFVKFDTAKTNFTRHTLNMKYDNNQIYMYGYFNPDSVEASFNNRIPYICSIDPYTFDIIDEKSFNDTGSINSMESTANFIFPSVLTHSSNNYFYSKLYKLNKSDFSNSIDSIITQKDSAHRFISLIHQFNETLFIFSNESTNDSNDYEINQLKLYDLNLKKIADQPIIDSNESSVSSATLMESQFHFMTPLYPSQSNSYGMNLSRVNDILKLVSAPSEVIESERINITLFPNPANSQVNILSNSTSLEYELFNIKGQLVKSGTLKSNNAQLNVSSLNNGVYFLKVGNLSKKIIIQR